MVRALAKNHNEKRQHILSTAAEVFAREGIARASMNEVARSAGISKANIYHYYDSKDALLFDILDQYLSSLRDRVCGLDLGGLTAEAKLHEVIRTILIAYEGMDKEHRIQTEGLPLLSEEKQHVLKEYQRQMVQYVTSILTLNADEDLGQNPQKAWQLTMSVFGMLNWFYQWKPIATQAERIAYAELVTELTLTGISSKPNT